VVQSCLIPSSLLTKRIQIPPRNFEGLPARASALAKVKAFVLLKKALQVRYPHHRYAKSLPCFLTVACWARGD
jgi:hypothetical protein